MKKILLFAVIFALIISISITSISAQSQEVPAWIKNNAGWWADGTIDDTTFLQAIQFLIKNGIIIIEQPDSLQTDDDTQMSADKILQTWGLTGCERDDDATSNWHNITDYTVDNGKIILDDEFAIPNELKEWQIYDDKHHESWNIFTQVVPPQYMNDVIWFTIFTDGIEWLEMDVFLEQDSQKWSLFLVGRVVVSSTCLVLIAVAARVKTG